MENKIQVQDHSQEILSVIRSNASPGILRNKLEDYHENDLADIFPELTLAERRKICRILDTNMLSDIFEHIDQKQAAEYPDEMDIKKAASILSAMETDSVVDVLKNSFIVQTGDGCLELFRSAVRRKETNGCRKFLARCKNRKG